MDFFSAVQDGEQSLAPTDAADVAVFANAIAERYGDAGHVLRARLTPEPALANMSLTTPKRTVTVSSPFVAVLPAAVHRYLDDPNTLIVDIRPHAAYADARLPRALSLSVPSTLLKRPLFSLDRLAAMLPSPSARTRFSSWSLSTRILVYDADAAAIPESSNIYGLLRKFKAASYPGELAWLRGGFQAVWREQHHLIDTGSQPEEHDDDDDHQHSGPASPTLRTKHLPMSAFSLSSTTASRRPQPHSITLPIPTSQPSARPAINPFFDTIRQNVELSHGITERIPLRLPARVRRRISDLPFPWLQDIAKRADRAQHYHRNSHSRHATVTAPSSSSSSSFSSSSDSDAGPSPAFIEEGTEALAMQFYRIELAEQRRLMGVMEHHSKESGRFVVDDLFEETHASLVFPFSITAGVEKGAKNRYRHIWPFEHARVRLHNANLEDDTKLNADTTATIEKCRKKACTEVDDYVNASYVQPLGTNRRYIATQGPLEATFDDFWRLVWQQNVHVIVMLTKEVEGSMIKCSAYWADTRTPPPIRTFGPLRLTLVSKIGLPVNVDLMQDDLAYVSPATHDGGAGFEFPGFPSPVSTYPSTISASASAHAHKHRSRKRRITTIKRTFALTHADYPHLGARTVVQLQYLEWPDMNVPDDARGVLELVREVARAVDESDACSASPVDANTGVGFGDGGEGAGGKGKKEMRMDPGSGIARHALGGCRPVLLHCSAGVGRTGGFIAVDAVLDAVRREMRVKKDAEREHKERTRNGLARNHVDGLGAMDVDEVPSAVVPPGGQDKGGVVTVPLQVSGEKELEKESSGVNKKEGLVVHVPAVVVPTGLSSPLNPPAPSTTEGARTPMQAEMQVDAEDDDDGMFPSTGDDSEEGEALPTALTRKWAESVLDSYGASGSGSASASASVSGSPPSVSPPPSSLPTSSSPVDGAASQQQQRRFSPTATVPSTSSASASSTFPSILDSEDGPRVIRVRGGSASGLDMSGYRESSSLATSVSGGSAEGDKKAVQRMAVDEQAQGQGQGQRFRTFSAPQPQPPGPERPKFPFSLGLGGSVGSSPLAKSRDNAQERLEKTKGKAASDGVLAPRPLPASLGVAFPINTTDSPHTPAHPRPHPLSRSSPPLNLNVPRAAPSTLVSSSFVLPCRPATTVDYKEPRALHGAQKTPVALSEFEEPIWEVVQDMREQRMSLCQSLRQYVFVHAAIIEGALWLVDEERERERAEAEAEKWRRRSGRKDQEMMVTALVEEEQRKREMEDGDFVVSPAPKSAHAFSFGDTSSSSNAHPQLRLPPPSSSSHGSRPSVMPLPPPQIPQLHTYNSSGSGVLSDSSASSIGKRGASPTELLKENKQGEVLLSKRPSIKRKLQMSSPGEELEAAIGGGSVNQPVTSPTGAGTGSQLQQVLRTVPSSPMFR